MAAAADVLYTAVSYTDDHGSERYGYAMIPRETPGVAVHDDWDALGMRASGSNSVSFENVQLPASALRGGFPVGDAVEYMERNLNAGLFHAAAALGIAESAHAGVADQLARRGELDAYTQVLAAENVVDLSACRAMFFPGSGADRRASGAQPDLDRYRRGADGPVRRGAEREGVRRHVGVRIVDRALALSGGAGYLNGSPLARAYRDVRATAFMHPLGANRAYGFLGQLALGREPSLH